MRSWILLPLLLSIGVLGGCARPPSQSDIDVSSTPGNAYAADDPAVIANASIASGSSMITGSISSRNGLRGRTLRVASASDITLRPKELVLTFDDGPHPTRTAKILDTLSDYGVRATFLMVGHMVDAHPEITRTVAEAGHSVGSHTHDHANLAQLAQVSALSRISDGQRSIERALASSRAKPSPFFRFPYLADTRALRTGLADGGAIILDVDIDSKDYYESSSDELLERALAKVDRYGRGVILFHDIHARTVAMLPAFLGALKERGYKIVTLKAAHPGPFATPLVIAQR